MTNWQLIYFFCANSGKINRNKKDIYRTSDSSKLGLKLAKQKNENNKNILGGIPLS